MTDEDKQIIPLAPAKFNPRSDEEFAVVKPKATRQERSSKCLVYVLAGIVILSTSVLVFALVVMRARTPDVKLSLVTVKNLKYGNSSFPSFNMTLAAELRIKNTNFGRFKFENTTSSVLYGGIVVGEGKLSKGRVEARESKRMNIMADLRSYRLSDAKNLSSDMNSGMLKLSSHAQLSGRVYLLGIVKKRRTAVMSCTMNLNLTSSSIQDLLCS